MLFCFGAQNLGLGPKFLRGDTEEIMCEFWNVFAAITELRYMNADYIQTVEKIFAKQMLLDKALEILVCRGDDSYIDLNRCGATDSIKFSVGEHAKEPRLGLGWHVAYLIKKQSAAICLFEAAGTLCRRTGKCSFLMPKKF